MAGLKMIAIWCMSPKHPGKEKLLAFMNREDTRPESRGQWFPRADNRGERMRFLTGDDLLDDKDSGLMRSYPEFQDTRDARRHFESKSCPLPGCRAKLSCRGDRLDVVLDELWARGVELGIADAHMTLDVPLAFLAAKVASKK